MGVCYPGAVEGKWVDALFGEGPGYSLKKLKFYPQKFVSVKVSQLMYENY